VTGYSNHTDAVFEQALEIMADAGAVLVDPANIPTMDQLLTGSEEITVLIWEFKRDLNAYLATRTGVPVHSLADVIAFNEAHADEELQWFGQELMELAQDEAFTQAEYAEAVERGPRLAGPEGIDAALAQFDVDALVAPTGSPAWPTDLVNGDHFLGASSFPAAMAGYPIISVNGGYAHGLPIGISFMGTAFSEPTLIKLASGFEAAAHNRQKPRFLKTLPLDGPSGAHRVHQLQAKALNRMKSRLMTKMLRLRHL
jgi:amidase